MLDGGPRSTAEVRADYPHATVAAAMGVMSYAGVPVRDREGATLGTLCAASGRSHRLDQRSTRVMELLAERVVDHLPKMTRTGRALTAR